jgi:hypothetical protein
LQTLREQVGADSGQPVAEIGEPTGPEVYEVAEDEQRPAFADQVEGFRDRAVLVVAAVQA